MENDDTKTFDEYNTSTDSSDEDLSSSLEYEGFHLGQLLYSIMVLILYMAMQKRVKWKSKTIITRYFGLPIPINLIYETKDRWVYAAVFGSFSGTFLQLIFGGNIVNPEGFLDSILKGFYLFLIMMVIPLLFFALIASIHGKIQVLTHVIGLIYVVSVLAQHILICIDCHQAASSITPKIDQIIQYVYIYGNSVPIILCNALTGAYFLVRGAQAIINIIIGKPFTSHHDINHHIGYVKQLFAREPITEPSSCCINHNALKKLVYCFEHCLYERDPYFKYPVRILCVSMVIMVGLLVLTVDLLSFFVTAVVFVEDYIDEDNDDDVVKILVNAAYTFGVIIPVVSYVIAVISYILSIKAYRGHCKRVWKGDYSFMPNMPPATILAQSTFYVGWQIGMVIWAWLLYVILMVVIIMTVIAVSLALAYVREVREWVAYRVIILASAAITGVIFSIVQRLIARCLFAKGNTLIVNNSRLFHLYNYFLLFYNALVGLGKAIRRLFTSAVISLFFLPRLDRSLIILGFEKLDKGYLAYLSAVRVDAAYNNPVMNVFVYLLSQELTKHKSTSILDRFIIQKYYGDVQTNILHQFLQNDEYELKSKHSKAKKMWHLAYTLVRNPNQQS